MITDEDAPEMLAAQRWIAERIHDLTIGREVTASLIREVEQAIYDHRVRSRQNGLDFPELVLMCIPRLGIIKLVRRDAELPAIKMHVVNLVRECAARGKAAMPIDLAHAVRAAWPHIQPGDLVDEVEARKAAADKQRPFDTDTPTEGSA